MEEKLRTKNSEYWIEDSIVRARVWGELDEEEIREQDQMALELFKKIQGKKYGIIDIVGVRKANSVIRKAATDTKSLVLYSKIAIIYKNPLARAIASFFIAINKPPVPIKLFETVEQAKEWIKEKD